MTIVAALQGLVVRHHHAACYQRLLCVTVGAWHCFMRALQREVGLLFVVEGGRLPGCHRVAGHAVSSFVGARELSGVHVFVTLYTFGRSLSKYNCAGTVPNHRTMTFQASYRAVSPQQDKLRRGMIEGRGLLPGTDVMAKLAAFLYAAGL